MRHRHLKDSEGNWLIPKLHLPRIPKSDIRRSYGLMFANVYNSCDREFAAQFVDRLIPEDYVYVFSKLGTSFLFYLLLYFTEVTLIYLHLGWSQALTGPKEALTQFWYEKMHEAPDLLFSFDAERIKVRTDATSVLTGTFSIRGTKLVSTQAQERFVVTNERANDEGLPCEDLSKSSSLLSPASSPPVPISSSPSVAMKMANVAEEPPAGDEVFPVPKTYAFCVSGSMAFHINGDFQIERMEMNVEDYLATLLSSASLSV